jgi:predicted phage terminase large subunit-like protein
VPSSQEDIDFDRAYVERNGLHGFLKLAWKQVCQGEKFTDGEHIRQICQHLEAVSLGLMRRLGICVPPGSTKSLTTSVFWPAFVWGPQKQPGKKWLFTSFDGELASRDAKKCRDLVNSEWYRERWSTFSLTGTDQVTYYTNDKGGFRRSVAITGGITGRHPDITVVDDPTNAKNAILNAAVMKTDLKKVQAIWGSVLASRGADPNTNCQVVIMQRLHDEDLIGFLESEHRNGGPKFQILRLPMYYDAALPCKTFLDNGVRFGVDWRTLEGEALCPARWDDATLAKLKHELGNAWSAQYQQSPANVLGQIFQRSWFKFWTVAGLRALGADPFTGAGFDEVACSWDFTFKDTLGSDFVCGQVWGKLGPNYYMLERVYRRMNFPTSLTAIEAQLRRWPRIGAKLVEDKANGPAIIASLSVKVPGLVPINPEGGKVARANAVSYLHRAGNVFYMPEFEHDRGDDSHVECMAKFPLAKHDDSVDAETQMLNYWESNQNQVFAALAARRRELEAQAAAQKAAAR